MQKKQLQNQTCSSLSVRIEKVIRHHALLQKEDKIIVGVSGGADSLALLHILHALNYDLKLIGVYIDHGLRPEETREEKETIEGHCQRLQIPFVFESVNVHEYVADKKCSTEEASRILRYKALEKIRCSHNGALIAVAHTADDQVEEFFIRSIRGTGLKGLSGMRSQRDLIIRPLLYEPKEVLVKYLSEQNISFCHDSSNDDRRFLRNRVRLDLLPQLEKDFNPSIRQTILHNMDILTLDEDFLDEVSSKAFKKCVEVEATQLLILPSMLKKYHQAIQRRIIEKCFWQMRIQPGYMQIRSLLSFTQTGKNSQELHLADGVRAEKSFDRLVLSRPLKHGQIRGSAPDATFSAHHIPRLGSYTIKGLGKILTLAECENRTVVAADKMLLFLDMARINFPLLLRPPLAGERFRPYNAPGKKKISRYLSDKKVAANKRAGYPVLVSDSRIIALPGLQVAHEVRVTSTTEKILMVRLVSLESSYPQSS